MKNQITKKELMQVYYLNREIMNDTEELVELKIRMREKFDDDEGVSERVKWHEKRIVEKIRRCSEIKERAMSFINSIDDSLTRQVFYYRFVKSMPWKKVAYMTGGCNSEESVRKIAERYMKKMGGC